MTEAMKRRLERLERFNTGLVTITFEDGRKRKMNPLDALDTVFFSSCNVPVDADTESFSWLCKVAFEALRTS